MVSHGAETAIGFTTDVVAQDMSSFLSSFLDSFIGNGHSVARAVSESLTVQITGANVEIVGNDDLTWSSMFSD